MPQTQMDPEHRETAEAALAKALAKIGGQSRLGRILGVKQPSVCRWKVCPAGRVLDVARISGVSPSELRPDIYPPGSFEWRPEQAAGES